MNVSVCIYLWILILEFAIKSHGRREQNSQHTKVG